MITVEAIRASQGFASFCDEDLDLLLVRSPGTQVYLYLNELVVATQRGSWGTIKAMYR